MKVALQSRIFVFMPKKLGKKESAILALAIGVHVPILTDAPTKAVEIWQKRKEVARVLDRKWTAFWNEVDPKSYKEELKKAAERGEEIDLGEFYLRSEYEEGFIGKERYIRAEDALNKLAAELKRESNEATNASVLNKMISLQEDEKAPEGGYLEENSLLSDILLENEEGYRSGNCQAREKLMASLVQRVYPEMHIRYQILKLDGALHTRTLVELNGKWYAMELQSLTLVPEDSFQGTIISDQNDYIEAYIGETPDTQMAYTNKMPSFSGAKTPEAIEQDALTRSKTKLTITDDYLPNLVSNHLSPDQITNFEQASNGLVAEGENLFDDLGAVEIDTDFKEVPPPKADPIEEDASETEGFLTEERYKLPPELKKIKVSLKNDCISAKGSTDLQISDEEKIRELLKISAQKIHRELDYKCEIDEGVFMQAVRDLAEGSCEPDFFDWIEFGSCPFEEA